MDDNGIPWLAVYVASSKDQDEKWRCKATCVLRVRRSLPDDQTHKLCEEFTDDDKAWGPTKFITIHVS